MVPLHSQMRDNIEPRIPAVPAANGFLNHLRFTAMNCRAKPHTDLFEACALLQVTRDASQQAHADALMRCLPEALGKPAKLYAPGVTELTFDESWLVQLGIACTQSDHASMVFLLKSRVSHQHRRLVQFLIARISDRFRPL